VSVPSEGAPFFSGGRGWRCRFFLVFLRCTPEARPGSPPLGNCFSSSLKRGTQAPPPLYGPLFSLLFLFVEWFASCRIAFFPFFQDSVHRDSFSFPDFILRGPTAISFFSVQPQRNFRLTRDTAPFAGDSFQSRRKAQQWQFRGLWLKLSL